MIRAAFTRFYINKKRPHCKDGSSFFHDPSSSRQSWCCNLAATYYNALSKRAVEWNSKQASADLCMYPISLRSVTEAHTYYYYYYKHIHIVDPALGRSS